MSVSLNMNRNSTNDLTPCKWETGQISIVYGNKDMQICVFETALPTINLDCCHVELDYIHKIDAMWANRNMKIEK